MRVLCAVSTVAFLALTAGPALAQDRYATLDVRGGYTKPFGAAADSLKGQSSFGAGATIQIASRLHVGLTADWAHHSEEPVIGGPQDRQWNVLHAFVKLSVDLLNSDKVTVALNAGPGLMVFSPNQVLKDAVGYRTSAHFAGNVGGTITWWFADRIGIIGSAQADFAMKKSSSYIFADEMALLMPITGGFRFKI
jgi:hypothetical protein